MVKNECSCSSSGLHSCCAHGLCLYLCKVYFSEDLEQLVGVDGLYQYTVLLSTGGSHWYSACISIFLQGIHQYRFEILIINLFTPFLMCTVGNCTVLLLPLVYSFHICLGLPECFKNTTVLKIHEVGYTVLVVHALIL